MSTVYYELPNPGVKIWPDLGMGISFMGKADHNRDFARTHYSLTYGFHATGALNIPLKESLNLMLEMTWNFLVPPAPEEINLSGVILTVGLNFRSGKAVK